MNEFGKSLAVLLQESGINATNRTLSCLGPSHNERVASKLKGLQEDVKRTNGRSSLDALVTDKDGRDGNNDEIDDVLGGGEERGDDFGASFDHEMGDDRCEALEEGKEVEDS
jgi:hypothetical protein